jgi:hypothetical protein
LPLLPTLLSLLVSDGMEE